MHKPKMANSIQRNLVLAAVVSAIMLASTCTGADDSGSPGAGGAANGDTSVLPLADPSKDALNQDVTSGVAGYITPAFWPFTVSFYEVLNMILRIFASQQLPCTLWSLAPPRMACTPLN